MKTRRFLPIIAIFSAAFFISCENRTSEVSLTGNGKFSKAFLDEFIENFEPPRDENGNEIDVSFYGIEKERMEEITKNFGELAFEIAGTFWAETNIFSLKKIFAPKGTVVTSKVSVKNEFPDDLIATADVAMKDVPGLKLNIGDDKKSVSARFVLQEDLVLFDSSESNEEVSVASVKKNPMSKDLSFKLGEGGIIVRYQKKGDSSFMKIVLKRIKAK